MKGRPKMKFKCERNIHGKSTRKEHWDGEISSYENYGSHYELVINSRSRLVVLLGKTSCGNFACIPDFGVGCHLSHLDDIFYNTERLCKILGKIDGITVANALACFYDTYIPF